MQLLKKNAKSIFTESYLYQVGAKDTLKKQNPITWPFPRLMWKTYLHLCFKPRDQNSKSQLAHLEQQEQNCWRSTARLGITSICCQVTAVQQQQQQTCQAVHTHTPAGMQACPAAGASRDRGSRVREMLGPAKQARTGPDHIKNWEGTKFGVRGQR